MNKTISILIITILTALLLGACRPKTRPYSSFVRPSSTIVLPTSTELSPTPSKTPSSLILKAPFVEQAPDRNWSQPWQDACEEAALLTASYYFQETFPPKDTIRQDLLNLIAHEESLSWNHDIDTIKMSTLLSDYFKLKPVIIDNPSVADIKNYLIQGYPIVVPANGKTLFTENRNFTNGGPYYHAVVILGFDDSKNQFIVHDVGTRKGQYFRYSYDLLIKSIHDFPSSGRKEDIETGLPKVVVVKN